MDFATAELTDEQPMVELAEVARRQGNSPGRIHPGTILEPGDPFAVCGEDSDMAQARSMVLVMLASLPMGEGNDQVAANILDAKWRPIDSELGNAKWIAGKPDRLERAVENVD